MRNLCAALLILLGLAGAAQAQAVGPTNQVYCNKIATMAVGPSSITQLIAPQPGQNISICGWHVTNTGATGTFSLQTGTGSNCGTGTATVIPAVNVTSTAPSAAQADVAQWGAGLGNALCITPSVATISAIVFYAQF